MRREVTVQRQSPPLAQRGQRAGDTKTRLLLQEQFSRAPLP